MNRHLQESSRRQDMVEAKVDKNTNDISRNAQEVEELRQELRRAMEKIDNDKEARDDALCDELREREIRRLNLIIHGLQERTKMCTSTGKEWRQIGGCAEICLRQWG
jgi:hypothetical protein